MQLQRTKTEQPPPSFHPSKPITMDPLKRYGNPLTFNIAVMFIFYVLSVSLCLSSFSTCVCVIFNPVGTFRTIANYISYALGLSVLLTFLLVTLTGVYFDDQASAESQGTRELVDEMLGSKEHVKGPATGRIVHNIPIQEVQHKYAALLARQAGCEELVAVEAECESPGPLNDAHTFIAESAARDDGAPHSTPAASASQHTTVEDYSKEVPIDNAKTPDRTPRVCEEISGPPEESSEAAEDKDTTPRPKVANHTETTGPEKAGNNVITARESKKIENWISQTSLANPHMAKTFRGMLKGDDTNDEDPIEATAEIMMWRRDDGDDSSEIRSMSEDSVFQKALRVYMGRKPNFGRRQRTSGNSSPNLGSSEESEFQGLVRKMLMLEKVREVKGGKQMKARSA
ncbi:hypothetical protein IMSHALPRED_010921 [Imshaugia aleurites]|uniref:Uncharacterized protein n=1 Tax=Imshaugia aleurites TaxID=172621 RepID=A0A8H3GBQ6_9LECA|nr:hypothetical protein IMSHALPRED_010921 [Imshaugia aleurites]